MKSLAIALWIAALGCLAAVPLLFLPWSAAEWLALQFAIELPDAPVVIFFLKAMFGVFGCIDVFFVMLARNPLGYGGMIELGGYGLILYGIRKV